MPTEKITIAHGLHTFPAGTVNHCPEKLVGLLNQLTKLGWKVNLQKSQDFETIAISICEQVIYENKDFLKVADFDTDGELDPVVKDAVEHVIDRTSQMVNL